MSRIIITDIHGSYKTLQALIKKLPKGVPITFAGDLIDRGPDSNKVIKFIREGKYDCVMGNHEVMMLQELSIEDNIPKVDVYHSNWFGNGGQETLISYKKYKKETMANGEVVEVPTWDVSSMRKDLAWLSTLPYFKLYPHEVDDKGQMLLVTHTTASNVWGKHTPDSKAFKDGVVWDRKDIPPKIKGIYNIYGHTPMKHKPLILDHFANIDTGACYKDGRYGVLTALQFPEMIVYSQKNIEKEE